MTFRSFSRVLLQLEHTPSRNEMTQLLVKLFRATPQSDVADVVYLALGRLAPLYREVNFNLADKLIIRAVAHVVDAPESMVRARYKATGDLGETTRELKGRRSPPVGGSNLSISAVYQQLMDIATDHGAGSVDRKLERTARLLRALDPESAKFVVRIILGNLRLGFSDKTILDALSVMIAGDKSAREKLEAAYNVRPDVGWLAKRVQSSLPAAATPQALQAGEFRVQSLSDIKPELGVPIMPALCHRLPSTEEIIEKMCRPSGRASSIGESGKRVAVEPKWDGQRIQAHAWILRKKEKGKGQKEIRKTIVIKLFTRSLEDITEMFPDLTNSLQSLFKPSSFFLLPSSFILDGEAVAIDPKSGRVLPFQTMITRKRKYGIQKKLADVPVQYMVFDILYFNGKSLMSEKFINRRKILEKILLAPRQRDSSLGDIIQLAPQLVTSDAAGIRKFLKQQIDNGLEGIVAKRIDAAYIPGRTGYTWVKLKWEGAAKSGGLLDTVDCVVMGTYAGRGKRSSFGVGAFLVGITADSSKHVARGARHELSATSYLTISKIGTGLTDEQWKELRAKGQRLRAKGKPKEYSVPKELTPDTWLRPELVVEIQADNITKSPLHTAGYALRFPRLVRYRNDKRPEQVTTLEEVEKLYQMSLKH